MTKTQSTRQYELDTDTFIRGIWATFTHSDSVVHVPVQNFDDPAPFFCHEDYDHEGAWS